MEDTSGYLDLYDYRLRVAAHYRHRNEALAAGEDPVRVLARFREMRDDLFAQHPQSALEVHDRDGFRGLTYYPYNAAARIEATVDTRVEPQHVDMGTSGAEAMPMQRVAILRFELEGRPAELTMYWIDVYGGGLFLPFRDATAPKETYGGGRYLFDTVKGSDFLSVSGEDGRQRVVLDFNYAYNPSCSYNYRWVCPLAPRQNHLTGRIEAGEKRYVSTGDR